MSEARILDASAVLAYLQEEPGEDRVEAALDEGPCQVTTVNLCEVFSKLCEKGMALPEAQAAVGELGLTLVSFDAELAALTASLRVRTKPIGASLGDRSCLAFAQQIAQDRANTFVYTTEQAWTKLRWPFKIVVIR